MADHTDTLMREVGEELRREKYLELWQRYGMLAIAAAALFVFGIGGWKFMQHQSDKSAGLAGERFMQALQHGDEGKQEAAFKALQAVAKDGSPGFALLAQLRIAGAEAQQGRFKEAVAAYDVVAKNTSADPLITGFAKVQAAMLSLGTADFTEIQERLKDVRVDSNPYRSSAREIIGLAALKAGRIDDAQRAFTLLVADKKAPQSVGERARIMMAVITEQEIAKSGGPAAKDSKSGGPAAKDSKSGGPADKDKKGEEKKSEAPVVPGKPATEKASGPAKDDGKSAPVAPSGATALPAAPAPSTPASSTPASSTPASTAPASTPVPAPASKGATEQK